MRSGNRPEKPDWEVRASRLIRARLALSGMSQKDLAERLSRDGRLVSAASINSKVARGTFSAAFLLEVLAVLDTKSIDLS